MAPDRRSKDVRISSTAADIDEFLDRLADDPSFRNAVQSDPRAALLEYRIDVSAETIRGPIELPGEDEIQEFRNSIRGRTFRGDPDEILGYTLIAFILGGIPRP